MRTSAIEKRARELIGEARDKLSPRTFLAASVRDMEREDVEMLAVAYLLAQVKQRKRAVVAQIERAHEEASRIPKRKTKEWYEWLETPEGAKTKAFEIESERRDAEITRELYASINSSINKYANGLRMDWEDELLRATFALADGTKVTWGDATREQHEWRAQMHTKNAMAGAEGASRHNSAIRTLTETGATSLNEAMGAQKAVA